MKRIKTASQNLLLILFVALNQSVSAQNVTQKQQKIVDSLIKEFRAAKNDTVRLKLRLRIGYYTEQANFRFWDSILTQSRLYSLRQCEITALTKLGYICIDKGQDINAQAYLQNAVDIAKSSGLKHLMLIPLYMLGNNQFQVQGNVTGAIETYYAGIRAAKEVGDEEQLANFYTGLGTLYLFSGEPKKALEQHREVLELYKKKNFCDGIASALADIGTDYLFLKDTTDCVNYYLETKKYIWCQTQWMCISEIYKAIGSGYALKRQYDSSEKYLKKAYNLVKENGSSLGMASTLYLLANEQYLSGKSKGVKEMLLEALRISRSIKFVNQIPDIVSLLKKIALRENNYKEAYEWQEVYRGAVDSISNEKNRKLIAQKQFEYELGKKASELKLLASQNQVQGLELSKRNYLIAGLALLLVFVVIIAYLLMQQSRIRSRQQRIEFTQKLLRSQINPHFMSNCLSAIQGLMLSGRISEAAEYQAKFSYFLRKILDTSEKLYISLSEELESVKLYLELEQLRFENNFEITLQLSDKLPVNDLQVPSFIIQPFIENAIWHGLLPLKNRAPRLILNVYEKDDFVFFEIEDNGVGRSETVLKTTRSSRGSRMVMDIISSMNQLLKNTDNAVEITDLFDEHKLPSGTRVTIRLKRYLLDE